jgi:hypothetical protein
MGRWNARRTSGQGWHVVVAVRVWSRVDRRRGWAVAEREHVFHEGNMLRRVDTSSDDVVAAITTMIDGVPNEHTRHRARAEFVCCCSRRVGVAEAPKGAELVVVWWCAEQQVMRRDGARSTTWPPVDKKRRRVQSFGPKKNNGAAL